MSGSHVEIERTFAVRELPTELGPGTSIEQHYIALDGVRAVRVRREGDRCSLTVKGGRGRERTEVDFESPAAADSFVPPAWFGDELTDRTGWSNAELAVHGRPTS